MSDTDYVFSHIDPEHCSTNPFDIKIEPDTTYKPWFLKVVMADHHVLACFLHDYLDNWLKMWEEDMPGTPSVIISEVAPANMDWGNIPGEIEEIAAARWVGKLKGMREAFRLMVEVGDEFDRTPEQNKAVADGLLDFAAYFEALWD